MILYQIVLIYNQFLTTFGIHQYTVILGLEL